MQDAVEVPHGASRQCTAGARAFRRHIGQPRLHLDGLELLITAPNAGLRFATSEAVAMIAPDKSALVST